MTDREKYLTILDRFYRGRGGSLLTKDECEAMEYAISSIKTDLKYDLLYEETTHTADADKMIEPTIKNDLAVIHTDGLDEEIRCTMCTNHMKSDRGCDGSCVVNKDMYRAVMDAIEKRIQPSVTPQEPRCKNCKWWKDSDGEYRRGCGAESICRINTDKVYQGEGYCYLFEPQESESDA